MSIEKMGGNNITTVEMEVKVARFLNPRVNLIVPNVGWGFEIHECDLLVVTASRRLWEVEIKISRSDLIADGRKKHGHRDPRIKRLYFAIPDYLKECVEHIPERAGIIVVKSDYKIKEPACSLLRSPIDQGKYKVSDLEYAKLCRLGTLRIWDLKQKIIDLRQIKALG